MGLLAAEDLGIQSSARVRQVKLGTAGDCGEARKGCTT
jgi:hypothetical protein